MHPGGKDAQGFRFACRGDVPLHGNESKLRGWEGILRGIDISECSKDPFPRARGLLDLRGFLRLGRPASFRIFHRYDADLPVMAVHMHHCRSETASSLTDKLY